MTTVANLRTADSSHWYYTDGIPCYELPKKDGSGMKVPTLADARKLNLLPSVTTILKILHKQALVEWLIEQAVLAVMTTPRQAGEADDAFIHRVLHGEKIQDQESQAARDRGTEIHAALEAMFVGAPVSEDILPWVQPVYQALVKRGAVMGVEKCIVGEGYAGKLDLQLTAHDGVMWLFDYKTSKKLPDKPYAEHRLQLSAYRDASLCIHGTRCANVYISTLEPGKFTIVEHENEADTFENGFLPLLRHWQWANGYCPEQ